MAGVSPRVLSTMVSAVRDSRGRVQGVIMFASGKRGRGVGGLDQGRGVPVLSHYLVRSVMAENYPTEYNTSVVALLHPLKR